VTEVATEWFVRFLLILTLQAAVLLCQIMTTEWIKWVLLILTATTHHKGHQVRIPDRNLVTQGII
jgi:hypothetical protein